MLKNANILLLGPGKTIEEEKKKIRNFIKKYNPIVISINFIPEHLDVNYVFLSNPRRYIRLSNALKEEKNKNVKVIATSNVTKVKGDFYITLNNSELLDKSAEVMDYSFIMLLKALKNIKIKKVTCAGLDGYSETKDNYVEKDMEYWFARRNAAVLNNYVQQYLYENAEDIFVSFLTPSYYVNSEEI